PADMLGPGAHRLRQTSTPPVALPSLLRRALGTTPPAGRAQLQFSSDNAPDDSHACSTRHSSATFLRTSPQSRAASAPPDPQTTRGYTDLSDPPSPSVSIRTAPAPAPLLTTSAVRPPPFRELPQRSQGIA